MHRFFLPPDSFTKSSINLPADTARQISRVLRLDIGDEIIVLDNKRYEYLCEIETLNKDSATAKIISQTKNLNEPRVNITMALSLTQRDKFEWMLQKCTELGAAAFIPVQTSRTLIQDMQKIHNKLPRWRKIVQEAAEQSARGLVPDIHDPITLQNLITTIDKKNTLPMIPWEDEEDKSIKDIFEQEKNALFENILILIGPEGGFSIEEVQKAENGGFRSITLGRRILRMETAAVAALAQTLFIYENWQDG